MKIIQRLCGYLFLLVITHICLLPLTSYLVTVIVYIFECFIFQVNPHPEKRKNPLAFALRFRF